MTTPARLSLAAACVLVGGAAAAHADPIVPLSYTSDVGTWIYHDSGNELIDGVWSTTGINPAELWMGWSGGHPTITFDLGPGAPAVGAATVVWCNWTPAAVYLPTSVQFQFSDDPTFTTGVVTQTWLTPINEVGAETVILTYDFNLMPAARYARLAATHDRQWLFIGEVSFSTVPTPAAAALLGLGALGVSRRRRA